ncbi:RAMP superfamily CRISPR-associated protein [Defluviitalea phaphyphila]|uniref:RAMP superfamily CRISPR-associated protein n=1 Tax=Defluviitalea phaphyphila TaxID=1473580 RepID=UPI000730AD59|nr:RAMP superfamily CRISPR-associated protein [Defluviitalea phaphyphila]
MKTIKVKFNTLTPIYFGNAIQDFTEIRPSAILGCMRFWLDVVNVLNDKKITMDQIDESTKNTNKEDSKPKINEIILKKLFENPKDSSWDEMILEEYKKTFKIKKWSDLLFGCENFKGNITIEKITDIKNNISEIKKIKIEIKKNNKKAKCWFLPSKLYIGKLSVKFKVNELLLEDYFYPLLYFINEVGYLGGKWNLGFGRVEVLEVIDESIKQEVNLKKYAKFTKSITIKNKKEYDIKKHFENIKYRINDNKGQLVVLAETNEEFEPFKNKKSNKAIKKYVESTYKSYITDVLKEKTEYRNVIKGYLRHKVFGTTKEGTQGSKVLPYVGKDDSGNFKTGFLLLDGLYY